METPKDYFQKIPASQFGFIEKKPFALRVNPLIDQNHRDFLYMEQYFQKLLRETRFTIEEILQNNFEPYEIRLFEPVAGQPELTRLQHDNSVRFLRLLDTRFKGRQSTLQLKMAFLYFGLPVAPMKPGAYQVPMPLDLDFGEDNLMFRADPLQFLDEYTERSYGDSNKRVTSTHFFNSPPTQHFSSLTLRGGSSAEAKNEDHEDDDDSDKGLFPLHICGFQGVLTTVCTYFDFQHAVDRVLGSRLGYDYKIRLQAWGADDSGWYRMQEEAVGRLFHDITPDDDDPLLSVLMRRIDSLQASDNYAFFVSYDLEDRPNFFQPDQSRDREVINLFDEVTDEGIYMRVPPNLQPTHKSNQLVPQYQRAIQGLYLDMPHQYLQYPTGITYGILDPPPDIWNQVIAAHMEGGPIPQVVYATIPIPPDYVPVLVPGYHQYSTDFSKGSTFTRDDLAVRMSNDDFTSIAKLTNAVYQAHPRLRGPESIPIEVWIPGQEFMNTNIAGQRINLHGNAISALADWRLLVHNFRRLRLHANNDKLSVVVRPVYRFYQIQARDDHQYQFSLDINRITLDQFKNQIKKNIFPEYQDVQVLYLTQSTWGENRTEFVITADTDEEGWKFITRRITEQHISVSVESWNNRPVNENTEWGPRYYSGDIDQHTSVFEDPSQPKPQPYSSSMNMLFGDSGNDLGGAVRAARLRERFFSSDPSIFANPTKPAIPLQAPPIETIISTGPNVPAFTTAMRTPTEVARLEREVHTLRGNLLGRIKECPYLDCKRYFTYADGEGLARHLREDHLTMQCFLCPFEKNQITQYDSFTIRKHFLDEHYDQLKQFFGATAGEDVSVRYCSRCGRDQARLNNPIDSNHHDQLCNETAEKTSTKWCTFCGEQRDPSGGPCACGKKPKDQHDVGQFCEKCGMEYDESMDKAYRERHSRLCRKPSGVTDDFCPKCGQDLTGQTAPTKERHILSCGMGPDPGPGSGPSEPSGIATGFSARAVRGGRGSKGRLDIEEILDILGSSVKDVGSRRTKRKNQKPQKAGPSLKRSKKATVVDPLPPRARDSSEWNSPEWDNILGKAREIFDFFPEPQWRCSRCFRCAGSDMDQIEMHMDEYGSCRIRRGLGTTQGVTMPNRSGWIACPQESFDFHKAYFEFVKKYPEYRYTMFPTRPQSVAKVWEEPYDLKTAVGSVKDDPNFMGVGANPKTLQSHHLPWPPSKDTTAPAAAYDEFDYGMPEFEVPEDPIWNVLERSEEDSEESEVEGKESISTKPEELGSSEDSSPWDPDVPFETKEGRRKRKRHERFDPSFSGHTVTDTDVDEEYSEASAVSDPITNLDLDAPPTPKVKKAKKAKKSANKPRDLATPFKPFSAASTPKFWRTPTATPSTARPSSSGIPTGGSASAFFGTSLPGPYRLGRAGSLPPGSVRSHFATPSQRTDRPSTSQSITTSTSWWPRPGSSASVPFKTDRTGGR
ncbi:hypothetical protein F4818DRAFT_455801 [Hypoxylon cercidicola]|nr:hypothetical protein F4818DRAFT_455801 [Hypoxylon cercidicola]